MIANTSSILIYCRLVDNVKENKIVLDNIFMKTKQRWPLHRIYSHYTMKKPEPPQYNDAIYMDCH